jgi:hypothetical protein
MAPLLVGERAEGSEDASQIAFEMFWRFEARCVANISGQASSAALGMKGPTSLTSSRRIGLPLGRQHHPDQSAIDVPIQSTCSAPVRAISAAMSDR